MDVNKIFDAFLSFSDLAQRLDEKRNLHQQNIRLKRECGGCQIWMTQQCKREAAGRKVTCSEIKCDDFKMTNWVEELITKNELRIKELSCH